MSGPPPNAVTERLTLSVNGGVDDWKEQLKSLLLTLKKQPGYMRTRWGPWEENRQKLELLVGWASPEDSANFRLSQDFAESMSLMKTVESGEAQTYFIKFKPLAPKAAIDSPVVEVITIKDCSGNEEELRAIIEKSKTLPGCNGCASGYSTTGVNGGGRSFVGAIGWQSVDISKAADKSVYVPTGAGETEIHHVNFLFPIKGFSVTN